MDTQTPNAHSTTQDHLSNTLLTQQEFLPGMTVIYATHGRCHLIGIVSREVNGKTIHFYKLERQKSSLSRSNKKEPAIWIPVKAAKEQGLRLPIAPKETEAVLKTLLNREYYFDLNADWSLILPKLESTIRTEGAIGLAKVASYLYVLKRKTLVPRAEINRFQELINKLLLRELSDATKEPLRTLEDRIARGFKQKLLPDT